MKRTILSILALVLLVSVAFADDVSSGEPPSNSDTNFFLSLYRSIEKIVVPKYDANVGSPTQVLLFEMPGLAINRDELDLATWQANGFRGRQPDAVLAQFVDRLPYYTNPTFVDSGSTISRTWGFFLYQYIIPVLDNPVQEARVNAARDALNNGTLVSAYDAASAAYEQSYSDLVNFRSACLARSGGGVCSGQAVVYRERLKRKWFTLEVARRDIAAAEAKIIALQIQDLKNVFAEQLFTYASNERVDMGDEGFGGSYFQTYCTPSNWYKWWAPSGAFDYVVTANSLHATLAIPATATIVQAPQHGTATPIMGGNYTYTPNTGYTGADSITFQDVDASGNTYTKTYGIGVAGPDVYNADSAFVTVSATSSSSSKDTSSWSTTVKTHFDAKGGTGLLSVSGSADVSSTKTGESLTTSGSTFSSTFDIARVAITRPWLDTSILSYYPVAIRTINANGWSDGTIAPADNPLTFKFKLLPVAFIVARNIAIVTTFSSFASKTTTSALSVGASIQVSYGPFFSGGASTNVDKTNRDYHEESKFTSNGLYIRGPQVIAWVCTALPAFPTADEKTVRKWEEENKNKADAQIQQVTDFAHAANADPSLRSS